MTKKNFKVLQTIGNGILKSFKTIIKEMSSAWYMQVRYGETILDSSLSVHTKTTKFIHEKRIQAIKSARLPKELPSENTANLPFDRNNCIPFGDRFLNLDTLEGMFLVLGLPGSGKTLLSYHTLSHVLSISNRRVVIFDPKNDVRGILEALEIQYHYFNISSKNGSSWAVEKDFQSYNKLRQFATILLPDEKNSIDSFWLEAARALVVAVMCVFIYKKIPWKFQDIVKAATTLSKKELIQFLEQFPGNTALIKALFSDEVEKTAGNVTLEVFIKLQRLVPAAVHSEQAEKHFSLTEFMEGEGVLVIGMDLSERETSSPIIRALFRRIVDLINSLPEKPDIRTFLFIEEAYFLGRLDGLDEIITFGRSKNAIAWIILQGIEGFYELFQENVAELILGLCRYVIALRSTPKTADFLSKLFGIIKVFKRRKSDGFSQGGATGGDQVGEESEAKILNSAFLNLPIPSKELGLTGYFITPDGAEKRTISGDAVEQMKPKKVVILPEPELDTEDQVLLPWTEEEKRKFIYGKTEGENDDVDTLISEQISEYFLEFMEEFLKEFEQDGEEIDDCN